MSEVQWARRPYIELGADGEQQRPAQLRTGQVEPTASWASEGKRGHTETVAARGAGR
jgi:hypothetical protein